MTNVVDIHSRREPWEDGPPPNMFESEDAPSGTLVSGEAQLKGLARHRSPRVADTLIPSIERAERRSNGEEKPIALPWAILADHFGGGLWPGLHILTSGTGTGKTQWALQVAVGAAKADIPVLYVGLELGELDLALRVVGEESHVPWSKLWTGKAGPEYIKRARAAVPSLNDLPFHYEIGRPHGFPPSALIACAEGMREQYPEGDVVGSKPILMVVDFLQIIGDEPGSEQELRMRVGRASYALRDIANRLGIAVLCISSIARERYKLLSDIQTDAQFTWDTDASDCPINRRIGNTDAIVGAGKESGDIEFSADSVSILARVRGTWDGHGCDAIFATAKGRATGAMWSPLRFTGYRYEECADRGGRLLEAWASKREKAAQASEEKAAARADAKTSKVEADADAIRTFVVANPGCSVRAARESAVNDSSSRWKAAVKVLGNELVETTVKEKTATGGCTRTSLTIRNGVLS